MLSKFLLLKICLFFIITQFNVSEGLEDIWKDVERLQKGRKGKYQDDGDGVSKSNKRNRFEQRQLNDNNERIPSSLEKVDNFLSDQDLLVFKSVPNPINKILEANIAGQSSNVNQYFESRPHEYYKKENNELQAHYSPNLATSFPQYLEEEEINIETSEPRYSDTAVPILYNKQKQHEVQDNQEDEEYLRNVVDSFLLYPDREESQEVPINQEKKEPDLILSDMASTTRALSDKENDTLTISDMKTNTEALSVDKAGTINPEPHIIIEIEGKLQDINKNCYDHYRNFGIPRKVKTKCQTCNKWLCEKCHAIQRGLPITSSDQKPNPDLEYQNCIFCNNSVINKSNWLVYHSYNCEKRPELYKVYNCCLCGKEEKTKLANLEKHIRAKHTGECPYICDHCGREFNDKSNLNKHVKRYLLKLKNKIED